LLNNHPREQLRFIIQQYGQTIIAEPKRCKGMLSDLAPLHRLENNLLITALEQKVAQELLKLTALIPIDMQLERLAQRLHDNHGTQLEFAYWAVESWALALNVIQLPILKQESTLEQVGGTKQGKSITVYKLGDVLSDGGLVFHLESSGIHGLAAKVEDELSKGKRDNRLSWTAAKTAASAYGSGWHLPTKNELNLLYQQKAVVGGFASDLYWSSTEDDGVKAWVQGFSYGGQYGLDKSSSHRVRAVRAF